MTAGASPWSVAKCPAWLSKLPQEDALRISTKITIAMSAAGLLLFGTYGFFTLQEEKADLRHSVEREVRLLARSLQVAVENALRDGQLADIQETLNKLERVESNVDILVYDPLEHLMAASSGARTASTEQLTSVRDAMRTGQRVLRYVPVDAPERLIVALPLLGDDAKRLGGLVVVRPLVDMLRDLEATRTWIALSVLLFVLLATGLGSLMGNVYIARPLQRLARAMGRVRQGDLESGILVSGRDEVGAVSGEFNEMVDQLRQARRQNAEEVESRRRMQRALEEASKLITIGQLSAGLAHEIGSPLQILGGRARLMARHSDEPETVRRNAEILVTQTDRITRIVNQLLQFARRKPTRMGKMEVLPAVRAVVDLLEVEARKRGVTLSVAAAERLPDIVADADELQQIVLNLVTNSLRATPKGGSVRIEVSICTLATEGLREPQPAVRLSVIDTGQGMSAEVRDRLFEPFFTTHSESGGTGLGLAVVKSLVTEHSGVIRVESEPAQGSRVTVDLPVRQEPESAEAMA